MATAPVNNWNVPKKTTGLVLFCCWLAILAEGYDVGVLGAILPALAEYKEWNLSPLALGGLGSYALIGMLIGALFIGTLSDLVGRKKMLLASMAIFTLTQAGAAWAPTPELFGLFRLIGGLGMGGVIPVAAALTIEYSAPNKRSYNYGLMYSGYSLGIVAAALAALFVLPLGGWRAVIAIGAAPVVLIPIIWKFLPESLEFLESKGRKSEAKALAAKLNISNYKPVVAVAPVAGMQADPWWKTITTMFSRKYLRSTVFFWISLFCGLVLVYGLNTWLPSIMKKAGYDLGSSLTFLLVFSLASAIGGLLLGRAADKYGKKLILVVFYILGGLGIMLLVFPNTMVVNLLFVAFAGVGSISTSLVLTGYIADYYPAKVRGTATGWALSFARLGAISGPLIGGWIAGSKLPFEANFAIFAGIAVLAAGAVAMIPKPQPEVPVAAVDVDPDDATVSAR
ncbi:aromatic acid/H+ symport family MFS transporter [Paenarthrobacter aurescens]|uniref:MFS transporter n=1 Tax=Paenarthrobacter aurescens TaxID=43663 RepID=A0A4Y3NE84_PAEAU|nr:aromatic acid/H+ symport family MFS transporter [Paenarthrobacter aurescens]MDO6145497.1 aromatic acid/H+ symport family MFS transporter [Paenarthrobacter aurescens]MDO6149306.1 aromatic acid/H+ symport family MFS transporter [Paenarthrobacter aurescens]MDO6160546.1 aromatic acid/H+ symport family MFS transporter [Paenarthrobacter aurescens]MDO6164405.1 aromatic acid/H+ symport family MFS transporter [Paenarthrobacter aurescens]GEB19942.1 MFS transporter [Paenarthrobacter aurescens]